MASIKHCISLREDLSKYAQDMSHSLFQDNFAMFIGYLVSCHKEGFSFNQVTTSPITEENIINMDNDRVNIIDGIEDYFENN